MDQEGTTRAVQNLLASLDGLRSPESWPEEYAQKRFFSKLEIPDPSRAATRRLEAYENFVEYDRTLSIPGREMPGGGLLRGLLPGTWYQARDDIHNWCRSFKLGPLVMTNGSESFATRGFNSIESKLMRSRWACTVDCQNLWARTAWSTLALRRATRARFQSAMLKIGLSCKAFNKAAYRQFAQYPDAPFRCFRAQLEMVTSLTSFARFATVPKNNEEDRAICLEPIANMLVQRRVAQGFRNILRENTGIDLDTAAEKHRSMIHSSSLATIDLSKASDSFHLQLIEFLFPRRIYKLIMACRSPQMLGPDGRYRSLNKLSTMGNGYTFDIMSLVLAALARQRDSEASVFGDDIIISNDQATGLIRDLTAGGLVVNTSKTCVESAFRESCGAAFHDDHGYLESFDFRWPKSIHDCAVFCNKAYYLGQRFPSFAVLHAALLECVPGPLTGPPPQSLKRGGTRWRGSDLESPDLSSYFWDSHPGKGIRVRSALVEEGLRRLQIPMEGVRFFQGFVWRPRLASRRVHRLSMRRHTGKYFMYLYGARVSDDEVRGQGIWQPITYAQVGQRALRVKALVGPVRGAP